MFGSNTAGAAQGSSLFGGSAFGQQPATATPFGATSTATPFGSTTGATPFGSSATPFGGVSSAPSFGSTGTTGGFGTTAPSAFGAASTAGPFGTASTTNPFGATTFGTATSAAPFGAGTTTGPFGAASTTSAFGAPATSTQFGAPASTTNTAGFSFGSGGFGGFQATGGAFGSTTTGPQSTFSNVFGPAATPQNAAQPAANSDTNRIVTAVTLPLIYRDERDAVLTLFNQLQAKWGIGKGFYAQSGPPAVFTPENPFCKFKAIAYNALPTNKPEEGLVCLLIGKKAEEVKAMTPPFEDVFHKEVIKVPEMAVFTDSIYEVGANQCNVTIYVLDKSSPGNQKRMLSTELSAALESPTCKTALTNLGVVTIAEKTELNKAQLEYYLTYPPNGIDALLWEQAKNDNPDPKRLVPVPVIGFDDLRMRTNSQRELQMGHITRLEKMSAETMELEKKCEQTRGRVEEFRHKQRDIAHRVLKVMIAFETNRKIGLGIQSEEETLKASLEEIQTEMENLKSGKLNELLASVKSLPRSDTQNGISEPVPDEVSSVLTEQHQGISDLLKIMTDDVKKLENIKKILTNSKSAIN